MAVGKQQMAVGDYADNLASGRVKTTKKGNKGGG
jgi:hypothetical protein